MTPDSLNQPANFRYTGTYGIGEQCHKVRGPSQTRPLRPDKQEVHVAQSLEGELATPHRHHQRQGELLIVAAMEGLDPAEGAVAGVVGEEPSVDVFIRLAKQDWSSTCVSSNFPDRPCERIKCMCKVRIIEKTDSIFGIEGGHGQIWGWGGGPLLFGGGRFLLPPQKNLA